MVHILSIAVFTNIVVYIYIQKQDLKNSEKKNNNNNNNFLLRQLLTKKQNFSFLLLREKKKDINLIHIETNSTCKNELVDIVSKTDWPKSGWQITPHHVFYC